MRRRTDRPSFTRHGYRKALPFLLEDFGSRCAYSLLHHEEESHGLEVDHFDPRKKKNAIQEYSNLMPSARLCNSMKGNKWPTPYQHQVKGLRFLNPTKEVDYDHVIFEDPDTHELVGTTPAARYHIIVLHLNDDFFINQRRDRTLFWQMMGLPGILHGNDLVEQTKSAFSRLIPPIKPPPIVASEHQSIG